jgi:hypothetical protein
MAPEPQTGGTCGHFPAKAPALIASRHYEIAYHLLVAPLHYAGDAGGVGRLAEVVRLCRERLRRINQVAPHHPLSSRSAKARGHASALETGAVTADASAGLLEAERLLTERGPGPG